MTARNATGQFVKPPPVGESTYRVFNPVRWQTMAVERRSVAFRFDYVVIAAILCLGVVIASYAANDCFDRAVDCRSIAALVSGQ